jgi:hypothetical protein
MRKGTRQRTSSTGRSRPAPSRRKSSPIPKASQKRTAASNPVDSDVTTDETAEDRFARDLEIRGEAVEPTKGQRLSPNATHVKTRTPGGPDKLQRVRVKLF